MNTEYIPVHIPSVPIYDIFKDPRGNIHVISPPPAEDREIDEVLDIRLYREGTSDLRFEPIRCAHGNTRRYTLYNHDLHVQTTEITLTVGGNKIKTRINVPPKFENEIVITTLCKDRHEWVTTWANYHFDLGVDRIILYDNSKNNNLRDSLAPLISSGKVFYIRWSYPFKTSSLKATGRKRNSLSCQTTSQNHSLNLLSNCRIVGNLDVDEFINLQKHKNVMSFFDEYIRREEYYIRIPSRTFFNSSNKPYTGKKFFKIFECNRTTETHNGKLFIHPKSIPVISVHLLTDNNVITEVNPITAYFNHYIYLSNTNISRRTRTDTTTDNSILNI